jgi:aminodeoxyfutalosine synthase
MAQDPERMVSVTTLAAVAERLAQGDELQPADVSTVLGSHDLVAVGMIADEIRRQRHGRATTFVRVFEAHLDAVPATLPVNVSAGEFRLTGRPTSLAAALAAAAAMRRLAGTAPVFGYSLADLEALGESDTYSRLAGAGLDGIAELPLDRLAAPGPVRAARDAGLLVLRVTVDSAPADLPELLAAVKTLSDEVGGFQAFAPLPRRLSDAAPTTGYDDVKCVAVARMVLDIPSIQVDWPLYGPKLAQVGLIVGADDVDGVAASEPGALGPRRTALEEIRGNIRAAGLEPVERDGRFVRLVVDGERAHG